MIICSDDSLHVGSLYREGLRSNLLLSAHGSREGGNGLVVAVIYSLKVFTTANRPVDRTGADAQHVLNLVHQLKRVSRFTIHLVDEGEDRDTPHDTDLEQLDGLGLNTLGSVNNHDRAVGRHEGTVGILREVLMSRGVQDVNAVVVILKLHNGRGNGNTSLLLDLHPVGNRVLRGLSAFYGTSQIDGTSVEKKFLSQGCLTCIRVGNDRKGSSFFNFFCDI